MPEEKKTNTDPKLGPGENPVGKNGIAVIAAYLLILMLLIFFGLYQFWPACESTAVAKNGGQLPNANVNGNSNSSANVNVNAAAPGNVNANGNANRSDNVNRNTSTGAEQAAGVKLLSISPASGLVGRKTVVIIKGNGFKQGARVTVGGTQSLVIEPVTGDTITAEMPDDHPAGKADVAVRNSDGSADLLLGAYTFTCPAPPDSRLLLIMIFAGALGGAIHALRSFFWYVGHRKLLWSWVTMYLTLPFVGAAMAVVFFLIIRGGFMESPQNQDAALYLFGLAVITGLFSEQAALKLRKMANALFTEPAEGEDNVPQESKSGGASVKTQQPVTPTGAKIDPDKGPLTGGQEIKITGTGLSSAKTVMFGSESAGDLDFDTTTSTITCKTPSGKSAGEVDVTITSKEDKTVKLKYKYE